MKAEAFFISLQEQLDKQLPFVAYCKPNAYKVLALLQKNNSLFKIDDFLENGFVFAPFDGRKDAILIPFAESKGLRLDTEHIDNEVFNTEIVDTKRKKEHHLNLVSRAIQTINKGTLDKVVLSRTETISNAKLDVFETFKRLINQYNSAFVYCWYHPKVGLWLGATPETLLKIDEKFISTMSLAGTQEYQGIVDAQWNDKEKNEQQLVTDYIINNLKPYVKNIEVGELETIKAGSLLHLRTKINGVVNADEFSLKRVVSSLHPTPAVCGIPKLEALQFILNNENYNREFYSGFLGELNYESKDDQARNSELYVNLRCMQIKEDELIIYVGGGITYDSKPESEWEETVNKSKTMKLIIAFKP